MKNSTKIRLHLSKNLFESLAAEVIAEAKKGDMSGGAYTEAVKQPKAPKAPKADKAEEKPVKEMETKVAEKKDSKSIEELKAAKEKLEKRIHEMESAPREEGVVNEDASNEIMQLLQKVPELYDMLRVKMQMAPHEFDVLMGGIGAAVGTTAAVAKTVVKDLLAGKKKKKETGVSEVEKEEE